MAGVTSTRSLPRAPVNAPAPLFGVFLIIWIAFVLALIVDPDALDSVWHWLGNLPLLIQVGVWVLFLPVALGLWVWQSDLALWLRLALIVVIAVGNLAAFGPRPNRGASSSPERE